MRFRTLAFALMTAVAIAACRDLTIYPMVDVPEDDCDAEPCASADASTD